MRPSERELDSIRDASAGAMYNSSLSASWKELEHDTHYRPKPMMTLEHLALRRRTVAAIAKLTVLMLPSPRRADQAWICDPSLTRATAPS